MKVVGTMVFSMLLGGCASVPDDFSLQWKSQASELYFYDGEGKVIPPFKSADDPARSASVGLPGYVFTEAGSVLLHPGEHWVHFRCPEPESISITHWWPGVKHKFLAGRTYELHCEGSQPVIRLRQSGA